MTMAEQLLPNNVTAIIPDCQEQSCLLAPFNDGIIHPLPALCPFESGQVAHNDQIVHTSAGSTTGQAPR